MLRQKALVDLLGQVNTGGVEATLLFNKDGMMLAYSGYLDKTTSPNVFSALVASVWESFERKSARDELKETVIVCDDGVVCCTRVANQLLALKATHAAPIGMLRKKIKALAEHLERPLTVVSQQS